MTEKLRIIVGGFIGLYPTGGVTWDYIQYPLGLKLLGHDVYYIEDTVQFSRFQTGGKSWEDSSDSVEYLKKTMERFGFKDRWAYRDVASGECYGLSQEKVNEICQTTDVFINVSASTFLRDEYLRIPKRVFIDSDPMFTQIEYFSENLVKKEPDRYKMKFILDNHTHHFTFGENIGSDDCQIPALGFKWRPTRQPICLDYWGKNSAVEKKFLFSSVMNWSVRPKMIYDHQEWGQKNVEFEKFIDVPKMFPEKDFEIMLTGATDEKKEEIKSRGWKVSDPLKNLTTADLYQDFIAASTAEFSIAKETYVKSKSGWFSCRSACYLAAGKPVVTQDTKWSRFIPSGLGLFAFDSVETAVDALSEVISDINKHSKSAREIAEEYFNSNLILTAMFKQLN